MLLFHNSKSLKTLFSYSKYKMPHIKKLVMRGFKSFARETEILTDRSMNVVVGPNGSGKSCSYDTNVLLADGNEVQIGDLVENQIKNSDEIRTLDDGVYVNGDNSIEIISLNKSSMKSEKKVVSKFIKRSGEIIYKIKTRTGKEVKATGCHPVMIFNEWGVRSTLIRDLRKGSLIATPRKIDIKGETCNPELVRLIGYLIGDGYIAKDRIEFINKDEEVIQDYKNLIKKYFDADLRIRKDKNATRIYFRNKKAVKKIRDFFDKNTTDSITSKDKKIPDFILNSDKNSVSNILAGLYDTDGSVRKDIGVIEFCTKNKELADQVQGLLLRLGIISKIKKRVSCASNTKYKIKRSYYYVYISGQNNLKSFKENIPLKINYKKRILEDHLNKNVSSNPNIDLLPKEINSSVRELVRLLGICYKPMRKKYPTLAAYMENRCFPTRQGILRIIPIFTKKLETLMEGFQNITLNQLSLVHCMDQLNISGQQASKQIGINNQIIRRDWATNKFHARPENLEKFYNLIKGTFLSRLEKINELISLLKSISSSEIYWDEIVSIEKLEKEKYVYDLTIEDNHNFIANNIFIHNSNVTDAICFVLGRLSIKSMRAAKASNLIFAGNKVSKPASEASVSMVFDNSDKTFSLPDNEITLKRTVKRSGQSIYRINGQTKTRQEILELLAQAGVDPHGFNIVLQGEISDFVKMHGDERRKVIEEVAGISVYENRKQKSLKELDRTDNKLKEVSAVLKERTSYMRNLEQERQQALRFKKLEETVKKCKASILSRKLEDKNKEKTKIQEEVSKKNSSMEKIKATIQKTQDEINKLTNRINEINKKIQESSGVEQETLQSQIAELKARIAGLEVRKENFQNQMVTLENRRKELERNIENSEQEIQEMLKSKGKSRKGDFEKKKLQLDEIEDKKMKFYNHKSSFKLIEQRIEDKTRELSRTESEADSTLERLKELELGLHYKDNLEKNNTILSKLKEDLEVKRKEQDEGEKVILETEKLIASSLRQIDELEKIKKQVADLDICPLCKTKIQKDHIHNIEGESNAKINEIKKEIEKAEQDKTQAWDKKENLLLDIKSINEELEQRRSDTLKLENLNERKLHLKNLQESLKAVKDELDNVKKEKESLEKAGSQYTNIEEEYDSLKLEVDELARHEEVDYGMEVTLKQRELDRMKLIVKQSSREKEELEQGIEEITEELEEKIKEAEEKEEKERIMQDKFKKMIQDKNSLQDKIRLFETDVLKKQNDLRLEENDINNFKIKMAEINAQIEGLDEEYKEFDSIELIKMPIPQLQDKLHKTQMILSNIGNVNLRALEVYEDLKKEYDSIAEKVETLNNEKEEILKIIDEIDTKKRRAFKRTLKDINDLFSRNFSQLSTKGEATLETENKEDLFEGGLDILIKVGKGKFFDVTSLSGGEQTLIALSLIFAIQEYRPYCFYIFDEIDAALDKRNSERLASLLKKHMKAGQYLIITHNDALITEASAIYGVTMQEGISKVLSLQV